MQFSPGSVFFGDASPLTAVPPATVTAANDGVSLTGTTVKLGQAVGALGNPAALLEDREIPLAGHSLIVSQIGGDLVSVPTSFFVLRKGASSVFSTPLLQIQTTLGAEILSIRAGDGSCIFIGQGAGLNVINSGNRSIGIGTNALAAAPAVTFENIAIGFNAMPNSIAGAIQNTVVGSGAGQALNAGSTNNLFGINAGGGITDGVDNSFIGAFAGTGLVLGSRNMGMGTDVLGGSDPSDCVVIGFAGGSVGVVGNQNVLIGSNAAQNTNIGANNILIGFNVQNGAILGNITNTTLIGVGQSSVLSNIVALGIATQNILLGFTGPAVDSGNRLQVNGKINTAGAAPLTAGAGAWDLGNVVAAASVLNAGKYLEASVNGVLVKICIN
jgi:hypothetical protein